jgi:hypothetical protein
LGWIKFDKDLIDDPRVLRAAEALAERYTVSVERLHGPGFSAGSDLAETETVTLMRNAVTGALLTLWVYADTHIREGDLLPLSTVAIDRMVGIDGFCELVGPDWVQETNFGTFSILPGYCEKNGLISKEKRSTANAERQRRYRERLRNPVSNASSNANVTHNVTGLDQDQDLDQKKQKKRARQASPVSSSEEEEPVKLPDWLPTEHWKAWLDVRKKIKAPNTPRALKLSLDELERLKSQGYDPKAVLDQATVKGWKFPYPLKEGMPATEPAGKICDYCSAVSTGQVNGRRACEEHWQMAMDNVSPLKPRMDAMDQKPRMMLGVVAKPVAGRD